MAEEVKKKLDDEEQVGVISYTGSKLLKKTTEKEKNDDCC
jgi:hypothetical protein